METPAARPPRAMLLARASVEAGPCRACKRTKLADADGWEVCPPCDTNPYDPNPARLQQS